MPFASAEELTLVPLDAFDREPATRQAAMRLGDARTVFGAASRRSSGAGVKEGGVGPHLEVLLKRCHEFDPGAPEIDGLVLKLSSEARNGD